MSKVTGKKLADKSKVYTYENIAIVDGKRTPFGKFNGQYSRINATELGVSVTKCLLSSNNLPPSKVDQLIFANTIPSSTDAIFLARHIALKAGLAVTTPASMVQRICASGLETIISAANDICVGASNIVIAGGTENMTRAPLVSFDLRNGFTFGDRPFSDLLWDGLLDTYCGCSMGQTAEKLAGKYSVTKEEADQFAFTSHTRAIESKHKGVFNDEISGCFDLQHDETIRDKIDLLKLKHLQPVFKENGVQTAGNSSLISDGAAAAIVSQEPSFKEPLGYVLGACVVGELPELMGISPVRAINHLLEAFKLSKDDIDLWEINEAFAAQYLAVEKVLELDRNKVNVNGGSIAIGHPLAATGIRLVITLLFEMKRRQAKLGVVSACVGGGQGVALLLKT